MPNWVSNTLNISGDENKIAIIKKEIANEETKEVIDFNKIVPMPPHSETFFADGGVGIEEREKYGKNNWYDWSVENWGTKWNCCETVLSDEEEDKLSYYFDTAWDPCVPIAQAIAKKYGVNVELIYADEDIGYHCGLVEFDENGNQINCEYYENNQQEGLSFIARYYGIDYVEDCGYNKNEKGEWYCAWDE
jgi:hypothetical protein